MKKRTKKKSPEGMPVVQTDAAGLDIGSREIYACVPPAADGTPVVRKFFSTTRQLEELADWLKEQGVRSVAMESTSVYWIPVYDILEARGFDVLLVNARHIKGVPGRKTDVLDCQWIQKLHECGLLKGSFRPSEDFCAVRTLVREKADLVAQRSMCLHKIQKVLDQTNVRLHHAVSDIAGVTGMRILRAICEGERDPLVLAGYRDHGCRKSVTEIAENLTGTWREEHMFNLKKAMERYDQTETMIQEYDAEILEMLRKLQLPEHADTPPPKLSNPRKEISIRHKGGSELRQALYRIHGVDLCSIDGINVTAALTIWSELGRDWSAFPSEKHFVSYLQLAPRMSISGGKPVKGRKPPRGTPTRIAQVLRMAASTLRQTQSALGADYRRYARIKGACHAVFITARRLAQLIYRLVKHGQGYVDIGAQAREHEYLVRRRKGLENAAKQLGYKMIPLHAA